MDTRSRKRQKNDATAEADITPGSTPAASNDNKPIVRDKTYYRETGDCVILVDTVLFKIHRFLLERDMSAFSNMFSLPEENAGGQTSSDQNPLILYDDVDEFRALCWILYALPTEHSRQHRLETANIENLVSLYLISHKYHFEEHEKFARDLLYDHCVTLKFRPLSKYNYFNKCPESRLQAILRIAILTMKNSGTFSTILQGIWGNRLEHTKGSISYALGVGEALGLQGFMAKLYYLELSRMKPVPLQDSLAYAHPVTDLAPHQKLALYQGNWSLRYYWSKTRQTAPQQKEFDCTDTEAESEHICPAVWKEGWKGIDDKKWDSRPFDPLKELSKIQSKIDNRNETCGDKAPCAVDLISEMIDDLWDSLGEHFFGSLPTSIQDVQTLS